jgi:serine/threonine protein kinase
MDRRKRLADLLATWQERAGRGETVSADDLCRDDRDLLPDVQRLMLLDERARNDERTALEAELETSATDLAVQSPVPPGDVGGWLAPPQGPGEIGRLGKYRIRRVIRSGGMGIVLEGDDPVLKRRVAIKVMHPRVAADPTARARFLREAEAMARLDHENVVQVFEAAEDPTAKVAYLVMPFLQGEPLDARLRREGRLTPAGVVWIGREVAEGLHAAHEQGLIHRDVKPSNIWIDQRGNVKLLDFGLARAVDADADLSRHGRVVGTPAYMAPEQARGESVDARADLFALGCVLYRAATGAVPFVGMSSAATMYSIATAAPPDPAAINPAVPVGLANLIKRLLAKDPANRPPSARTVARELAALDREEADTVVRPVVAMTAPPQEDPWSDIDTPEPGQSSPSVRRPPRPNRWPIRIAYSVIALAAVGLGIAVYFHRTSHGTVVVQALDPIADNGLKSARLELTSDGGDAPQTFLPGQVSRTLPTGTYQVSIHGKDLVADPARIEVRPGQTVFIRVRMKPPIVHGTPSKKTPPVAPADPERAAAEWVHGLGGVLGLRVPDAPVKEIGPKDPLPVGPFTVHSVRLSEASLSGGLFRLSGLNDLRVLELTDSRVTDADLAAVGGVTSLKEFAVISIADPASVAVTDAGLAHLARLNRLERLILAGQPVSDAGLAQLAGLTNLKVVGFPRTRIAGTGFTHLQKSANLQEVRELGPATDAGVAALSQFRHLTYVDLGDAFNVTDAGLKHLAGLAHLEKLIAHNSKLTDGGLKELTTLRRLRGLGADGTGVTDAGLVHLKEFPHLESLGIGTPAITDTGLKTLAEIKTLKWLNLRPTKATAEGVKGLHRALPECRIESDHGTFGPQ